MCGHTYIARLISAFYNIVHNGPKLVNRGHRNIMWSIEVFFLCELVYNKMLLKIKL